MLIEGRRLRQPFFWLLEIAETGLYIAAARELVDEALHFESHERARSEVGSRGEVVYVCLVAGDRIAIPWAQQLPNVRYARVDPAMHANGFGYSKSSCVSS
ncbi:MAG: hypothetical protein WCO60_16185 [Verrucomicrobiota bacterium]